MFSRDNRSRFNSENRVDLDSFFTEAAEIFRPVEAATSERIWNNVKHNLPPSTKRRLRPLAVAIAATFLILAVGVGGFAAGQGWLGVPIAKHDPVVKPVDEKGSNPPTHGAMPVAKTEPVIQLDLAMQSHPVAKTSFSLVEGKNHVLPLFPKDPLRPFANYDWFYPVPSVVINSRFDPAKRVLKFKLRQSASPDALSRARQEIAHAYVVSGRVNVKPEDINIQPLQRSGYKLVIDTAQGDLPVKERHSEAVHSGMTPVSLTIPEEYKNLIENLKTDPDFVTLLATSYYDFEYSNSASIEAQELRSVSHKALEEIAGGVRLSGPVIVDRRGKQEFLHQMRNEVVVWTKGYGLEAQAMTELALKQLSRLEPMTYREFLDQRGQLVIWNEETARLELAPEKYNLVTNETKKYLEEQTAIKQLSKTISDLAKKEQDESKFYDQLRKTFELDAKMKGGVAGIFEADLSMDLKQSYDNLSGGEKKSLAEYHRSASNESEFESKHSKKSDDTFRGRNELTGTNPKGFDLYLLNDEKIVGETLFGSHQVKLHGVKTVAVSEEIPIEVEPVVVAPIAPARPVAEVEIATLQNYAGRPETVPAHYLQCDGRAVARAIYPELFNRIGILYGKGDGTTTFNLPDARGEFIRGADDMGSAAGARGVDGGRTVGSSQSDAVQDHGHAQSLIVNQKHDHRIIDVYHINGGATSMTHTNDGHPLSMHALIAGFPYGNAPTAETPKSPDGIPAGIFAGPEQPGAFQGTHLLKELDGNGRKQDDRWAVTTAVGNPKQPVEGGIGGPTEGKHDAKETRGRNIATLVIIRAE